MKPPQILAAFRQTLTEIAVGDGSAADKLQHAKGAFLYGKWLLRSHPDLFVKKSNRPFMAELMEIYEAFKECHP